MTDEPVVGMGLQFDQLQVRHDSQVRSSDSLRIFWHDAVNAAAVWKVDGVSANVVVVPVENVNAALGPDLDAESDPGHIVGRHKVVAVPANKAGTFANHHVGQDSVFVNVAHE